jgi:hypothetical protein
VSSEDKYIYGGRELSASTLHTAEYNMWLLGTEYSVQVDEWDFVMLRRCVSSMLKLVIAIADGLGLQLSSTLQTARQSWKIHAMYSVCRE